VEAYLVNDMGINDSFQCEEEKYSGLKKAAFPGLMQKPCLPRNAQFKHWIGGLRWEMSTFGPISLVSEGFISEIFS
jgi:hypothetical protein